MKLNRTGVTRLVFVFKRVVVKIPKPTIWNHFLRGILSNINEHRTWKWNSGNFNEGRQILLCPVLWCSWGGWILIMKRAEPINREDWSRITDISSYKQHFGGDDTMSNYGWLDGVLVKLDYGSMDFVTPVLPPLTDHERTQIRPVYYHSVYQDLSTPH